jgi:hypothetical protein
MLDPRSRQLLRDALRPPAGYALDQAVLTTFSLDLIALLAVPLAFTFFPIKDSDGPPVVDPLALLEALRRSAGRISAFHQAGQVYVPAKAILLLAHLEETVVSVRAGKPDGIFHPKVTVLRYVLDSAETGDVIYRALVSSRNLTFDRSWDTLLTIEGPLRSDRSRGFTRNRPLSKFVATLPTLAVNAIPPVAADRCRQFADELLRVEWETPDGFDEMEFLPLGLDDSSSDWPVLGGRQTLAMAPFIDAEFIRKFEPGSLNLISRQISFDELPGADVERLAKALHLNAAADPVREDSAERASDAVGTLIASTIEPLHGLHAKLFLSDDGWNTHLYTGSANATTAAFERNVEFLVRLTGKKSKWGIKAFLNESDGDAEGSKENDKEKHFADLLVQYRRVGQPVDQTEASLDRLLDQTRYAIAGSPMTARVETIGDKYNVILTSPGPVQLPAGATVRCHPLTIKSNNATAIASPVGPLVAVFESLTFESITSFYGFHLKVRLEGVEKAASFVINVTLVNPPPDRTSRLLTAMLGNRDQLLRYLLLLLADDEAEAWRWAEMLGSAGESTAQGGGEFGLPLLEPLLRALDRNPAQLDSFNRVIDDLCRTPEGTALVGDRFLGIWKPVWAARKELAGA